MQSAIFYSEDLGVSLDAGERMANFMELANHSKAITSCAPWAKHGRARVYFDLWSQNSLSPIDGLDKSFYDAEDDEIYVSTNFYGTSRTIALSTVLTFGKSCFSGAKTRAALKELAEVFYG